MLSKSHKTIMLILSITRRQLTSSLIIVGLLTSWLMNIGPIYISYLSETGGQSRVPLTSPQKLFLNCQDCALSKTLVLQTWKKWGWFTIFHEYGTNREISAYNHKSEMIKGCNFFNFWSLPCVLNGSYLSIKRYSWICISIG